MSLTLCQRLQIEIRGLLGIWWHAAGSDHAITISTEEPNGRTPVGILFGKHFFAFRQMVEPRELFNFILSLCGFQKKQQRKCAPGKATKKVRFGKSNKEIPGFWTDRVGVGT